jgi:uncharacterized membrane protein
VTHLRRWKGWPAKLPSQRASTWTSGRVPAATLACLLVVLALPAASPARVAAGLILLLILPGMAMASALLPELRADEFWIRLVVSVGLSLATTCGCALLLALLGAANSGVGLPTAVAGTGLVFSVVGAIGRDVPESQSFRQRAVLPAALLLAALVRGVWIGRVADPATAQPFTVFSVVGSDGTVESLVSASNCRGLSVTLSVASHENAVRTYEVWEVSAASARLLKTIQVEPGQSIQVPLSLPSTAVGKVTFELRIHGETSPYRSLSLCSGG